MSPSNEALHHASPGFMDLMHIRLAAILELLRAGLDVWFTGLLPASGLVTEVHVSPPYV